jgi:hypothetical protein
MNKLERRIIMNHCSTIERHYNEICGRTFTNLFTLTKGENFISLTNLDLKNDEHLFVLGAALALSGVLEKQVAIPYSRFRVARLNKKWRLKDKQAKFVAAVDIKCQKKVNVVELLEFMRAESEKLCGETFSFGDIYHDFYEIKKGKKQ